MTGQPEKLEKQFFSDGYQLGAKAAENGNSAHTLYSSIREMHAAIDELTYSLSVFAKQQGRQTHCKKGCAWCCHQPVFALSYELEYLNSYLKKRFNKEKQGIILKRAAAKQNKLAGLEGKQLLNSKHPCPLLENSACIAYEARPVACRIYISTDVKSCLHFFCNPGDDTKYPALLSFPMRLGRMMNEGFKSALKAGGIQSEEVRIEEKILIDN